MNYIETEIPGVWVIEPKVFSDARGYFMETWRESELNEALGHDVHFVQDNQSKSSRGVLRGLHFQKGDASQAKLVRVLQGTVVDVAVENSLYGEIRANLNIANRYDADNFILQFRSTPDCLLSRMTGGVHLHTLSCPTPEAFRRIEAALDAKGLLYKKEE